MRMRDIIMGITPFPIEEYVEKYRKITKHIIGTQSDVCTRKLSYAQIVKGGE